MRMRCCTPWPIWLVVWQGVELSVRGCVVSGLGSVPAEWQCMTDSSDSVVLNLSLPQPPSVYSVTYMHADALEGACQLFLCMLSSLPVTGH